MLRPNSARACALAITLAVLGPACGGDDEPDAAPAASTTSTTTVAGTVPTSAPSTTEAIRTIEVDFAGGKVTGGVRRESVGLGEKVRIRVTSDVADELHVHTYDAVAAVTPDRPGEVELTASIPGRHEVELEEAGRQVLVLEVR